MYQVRPNVVIRLMVRAYSMVPKNVGEFLGQSLDVEGRGTLMVVSLLRVLVLVSFSLDFVMSKVHFLYPLESNAC